MVGKFVGDALQCARWVRQKGEELAHKEPLFEVRVWRSRRSLNQNAYYWVLLGRLGYVLGYASDELHRHMLREYGVYDVFTVRDDVPLDDYFRYYDTVGEGVMDGVRYVHVRAFKGSSEMDTAEFTRLLNGVIEECRQQGIETDTPEQVARMKRMEGAA